MSVCAQAEAPLRISGNSQLTPSGLVIESGAYREGSEASECADPPLYRKKLAILGFTLEQPKDAADIMHVSDGLVLLFQKRLRENTRFDTHAFPLRQPQRGLPQNEVHGLWLKRGIQFAVQIRMEDMGMQQAGQKSRFQNPFGETYHNGSRGLAATLELYDTLTGQLITTFPYATSISGSEFYQPPINVLSQEFLSSNYGEGIHRMLEQFSNTLNESLKCLPFAARIIDIREDEVVIDAGRLHGLKAGDRLAVYHQRQTVKKPDAPDDEGKLESPVASIILSSVQSDLATGIVVPGSALESVSKGDIARTH